MKIERKAVNFGDKKFIDNFREKFRMIDKVRS